VSVVIIGAGPNLGAAVARRFGREGMPVGLISRDAGKLEALAGELAAAGLQGTSSARSRCSSTRRCRHASS
jgi:short-subunit dehydrogenase